MRNASVDTIQIPRMPAGGEEDVEGIPAFRYRTRFNLLRSLVDGIHHFLLVVAVANAVVEFRDVEPVAFFRPVDLRRGVVLVVETAIADFQHPTALEEDCELAYKVGSETSGHYFTYIIK